MPLRTPLRTPGGVRSGVREKKNTVVRSFRIVGRKVKVTIFTIIIYFDHKPPMQKKVRLGNFTYSSLSILCKKS